MDLEAHYCAHNDHPMPVVITRGKGLFVRMAIDAAYASARAVCEALMVRDLLSKETYQTVVRLAPPLVIGKAEIDWAVKQIREVLSETEQLRLAS